MTAEEDTSYTKLPIEERCVHKVMIFNFFILSKIILLFCLEISICYLIISHILVTNLSDYKD